LSMAAAGCIPPEALFLQVNTTLIVGSVIKSSVNKNVFPLKYSTPDISFPFNNPIPNSTPATGSTLVGTRCTLRKSKPSSPLHLQPEYGTVVPQPFERFICCYKPSFTSCVLLYLFSSLTSVDYIPLGFLILL